MPGQPTPADQAFRARLVTIEQRLTALEHAPQVTFVDPTGATGDPANGNAMFVMGNLALIKPAGTLTGFGAASFKTGAWVKL